MYVAVHNISQPRLQWILLRSRKLIYQDKYMLRQLSWLCCRGLFVKFYLKIQVTRSLQIFTIVRQVLDERNLIRGFAQVDVDDNLVISLI